MDAFANLNAEYVRDRRVCVTGRLVSMTHAELAKLVTACGGTFVRTPARSSCILVLGDGGWPSEQDGSLSQVFDRARRLKAYGYAIQFTAEDEFLDRIGLSQSARAIRGPHTLGDLARILDLSILRLRRWLRLGLIQPTVTRFQIPFFDFRQVAFVKQLHELLDAGASLAEIRRGIDQARDLLPHGESLTTRWSRIGRDGRVLLRLGDQLVDHTGQQYFDFEASSSDDPTLFAAAVTEQFHDLCDEALELEEDGLLQDAADAYRRALQLKPDHPTLHFDLGNVLFQLGESEQSVTEFRTAVELEPEFGIAWHNLGSVYAFLGRWDQAESALRRALDLLPTFADSHFVLAEVLRRQGKHRAAAAHERAYHEHSTASCLLAARDQWRVVRAEDKEAPTP